MVGRTPGALVVLGCKVLGGAPSAALARRLAMARQISAQYPELPVVFSGGRAWQGVTESAAMRSWWLSHGTSSSTWCEDSSQTTLQNARETGRMLRPLGITTTHLVTCDFHMPRASYLFARQGFTVVAHPAPTPARSVWARSVGACREWGARLLTPFEMWRS